MADTTEISWTDATFNPWIGCTKVSPGCDNCYAARQDGFRKWTPAGWGAGQPRKRTKTWGDPVKWNGTAFYACGDCGWRGETESNCPSCAGEVHTARRRVFCASLADVFDNEVDPAWQSDLFDLVRATPNLDWLLLTKRIGNVRHLMGEGGFRDWPNVWLGATVVNQEEADRDIPKLLATPARVRFLSMEPLLGPVNLREVRVPREHDQLSRPWDLGGYAFNALQQHDEDRFHQAPTTLDWVIVGGESGPGARPMHPDWARSLRDQCGAAGVAFHFKQFGEWAPGLVRPSKDSHRWPILTGEPAGGAWSSKVGKKAAGRLLDGKAHDAFPEVA